MRIYLTPENPVTIVELFNVNDVPVEVFPDAGATITVEYCLSSREDIGAGTAHWKAWGLGPITGASVGAEFDRSVSALRLTATAGSGEVEYLNLGGL